jgi:DNA-binding transcriptional LysR family regulator
MIEIKHIRSFIAVAEELHFGRAAKRLNIAQPPLSQRIRSLEQEIGVALFERTKRSVQLTRAGHLFLREVTVILTDLEKATELARLAMKEGGTLKVGFVSSAPYSVFPTVLRAFRQAYPHTHLEFYHQPIELQAEGLRRGSLDVGLLRGPVSDSDICTQIILSDPFVVAMPSDHRLAACGEIRPQQLIGQPFIMVRDSQATFLEVIVQYCAKHEFSPEIVQKAAEMHMVLGLVSAGIGVALVPRSSQHFRVPGVEFRSLQDAPSADLLLAWHRKSFAHPVEAFVRIAQQTLLTV